MGSSKPIFGDTESVAAPIRELTKASYLVGDDVPWVRTAEGVEEKHLAHIEGIGLSVTLVRMAPGAFIDCHAHADSVEQLYLVRGDFSDGHKELSEGDYLVRRPDIQHLARTKNGATILVIFNRQVD